MKELERLYRERHRAFVHVAAATAGDAGRGADAVQEAFARALRTRRSFRGDASLESWVWRIVLNCARSQRQPEAIVLTAEPIAGVPLPGEEESTSIRFRIAALPARQREAVFLRYFADLDYRSIAQVLDIRVGTVSATLAAAHSALRQTLDGVSS